MHTINEILFYPFIGRSYLVAHCKLEHCISICRRGWFKAWTISMPAANFRTQLRCTLWHEWENCKRKSTSVGPSPILIILTSTTTVQRAAVMPKSRYGKYRTFIDLKIVNGPMLHIVHNDKFHYIFKIMSISKWNINKSRNFDSNNKWIWKLVKMPFVLFQLFLLGAGGRWIYNWEIQFINATHDAALRSATQKLHLPHNHRELRNRLTTHRRYSINSNEIVATNMNYSGIII